MFFRRMRACSLKVIQKIVFATFFFGIQKLAFAAFFGGFAAVQKSAKREPVASCFTQDILAQVPFVLVRI